MKTSLTTYENENIAKIATLSLPISLSHYDYPYHEYVKTTSPLPQVWLKEYSKTLCQPDCDQSVTQTPVFNQTIALSYKISDWYFCTAATCSQEVGRYLRLTFDLLYPEEGGEMSSLENITSYQPDNQPPHCKSR